MRIRFLASGSGRPPTVRKSTRNSASPKSSRSSRLFVRRPLRAFDEAAYEHEHEHEHVQDRSTQQWMHQPVPGQNHAIHNSSLRSEWGHNMYSTGVFPLGLDKLGCAQGALKLYSHGAVDESMYLSSHHQKLLRLFRENTRLLSGSLWSACYYLYLVARGGLCSRESSRDVHSQIFSPRAPVLSSLNFRQQHLFGGARAWNIFCRLGKSGDGRNTLSRPWISFQSFPARLPRWYSVSVDGAEPIDVFLSLAVAGSLKANHNQDHEFPDSLRQTHGSAFQFIADDLAVQCMYAPNNQKPFASAGAVIAAIRQRLLSYLPSSPIAAALDLNHIGLTLQLGSGTSRLVQNVLLNYDGSVKTDAEIPPSLPTREANSAITATPDDSDRGLYVASTEEASSEAVQTPDHGNNTNENSEGGHPHWKFSDSPHERLGMDIKWKISTAAYKGTLSRELRLPLEILDQECQSLNSSGVELLARGASHLLKSLPSGPWFALLGTYETFSPSTARGSVMNSAAISTVSDHYAIVNWHHGKRAFPIRVVWRPTRFELVLRLPGILGVPVKLGGHAQDVHVLLGLCARPTSNHEYISWDSKSSSTIKDEISFLRKAADIIIGRVCQATAFDSLEACSQTIAEAILHFLKFRSSGLYLSKVKVSALVDDGRGEMTYVRSSAKTALIAGAELSLLSKEKKATHAAPVDTINSAGGFPGKVANDNGNDVRTEELTSSETYAPVEVIDDHDDKIEPTAEMFEPHNVSSSRSDGDVADSRMRGDSTARAKLMRNTEGLYCPYISERAIRGSPFLVKTGYKSYRFGATWAPRYASILAGASSAAIVDTVDRALLRSKTDTLYDLLLAAAKARAALLCEPWCFDFKLWHVPLSGSLVKTSGRQKYASISIKLRTEITTVSCEKPGHEMLKRITVRLPPLSFAIAGTKMLLSIALGGTIETKAPHLAIPEESKGTSVSAQVQDIMQAVSAIIAPIMIDATPSSRKDLVKRCSTAIVNSEQPLAGLLYVGIARVGVARMDGRKLKSLTISIASGPGAAVRPEEKIYVALGSNIGDRFEAIESACRRLAGFSDIRVADTSPLYETNPMYVEDQNRFLNGVCEIVTDLNPGELLDRLQSIESDLGRHKTIDKGPRNIDLDILTYGRSTVTNERLTVPHALMLEREFVLRPLCDTLGRAWRHPSTKRTAKEHLDQLPESGMPMYPLTSLGAGLKPLRSLDPKRKTQVMSILNVTPDSFSDGGLYQPTDMDFMKATILANIAAGATIIDIGGQSSRPNAEDISAEEEISRVLPAIALIKSLPEAKGIAISIDTYRAAVAEAAINAGAHIVNDISAGLLDPEMLPTIARLGCTYIMMHMRGTPATMQNEENTSYPDGLIPTITYELIRRLEAAQEAGIRRWRIILDPGIGFAKTLEQNVELLKNFGELRNCNLLRTYPWLIGTSRKGFIGKITGVADAKDRVSGTAATVTAAVQGGAEIVRVHDVKEMAEVVKMADAMYRT